VRSKFPPFCSAWNHVFQVLIHFVPELPGAPWCPFYWEREAAVSNSSRARAMAVETSFFVNFELWSCFWNWAVGRVHRVHTRNCKCKFLPTVGGTAKKC
jgi:hypothetical protein